MTTKQLSEMKQVVSHPPAKPGQTLKERIHYLAEFYDHVDAGDLETEEVSDFPFPTVDEMPEVAFRLPEHDLEQLKRQVERRDVHFGTLLRLIV